MINGTVIPVPIIDSFGRVTGFDNTTDLQTAVGSFSWALAGNLGTTSGGNIGQAPTVNSNYIGTNDGTDLRLATNGRVRAILGAEGALTVGPLNVTGELISTGSASIGSLTGGSLSIQGPSGQATPLFRVQNFVGETLTDQVLIASNGTVSMKSLGGAVRYVYRWPQASAKRTSSVVSRPLAMSKVMISGRPPIRFT